jgi:hypothetical protein
MNAPSGCLYKSLSCLGASSVLSLSYGVVADICPPAERGKMLGPIGAMGSLGVCIGPVVGGWIAFESGGVQWVFWALVIFGGGMTLAIALVFPETGRSIVGNGSKSPTGWHRTWWQILSKGIASARDEFNKSSNGDGSNSENLKRTWRRWEVLVPRNPFFGVRIMFYKNTALVLFMASIFYATYYCVQTSIPVIYESVYSFNALQVGLAYLSGGVGVIIGASCTGRLMDHNYKITAAQVGHEIDKIKGDNIDEFPIEKARTRLSLPLLAIFTTTFVEYWWAIEAHTHCAVRLLLQSILGLLIMIFNTTYSALLVDIFPTNSSAAAATGNLARCSLTAIFIAVLQPAVDRMGRSWYFTLLGLLNGSGGIVVVFLLRSQGRRWRTERTKRLRDVKEPEVLGDEEKVISLDCSELSQPKSCSVRSGSGDTNVRDNMVCQVDTQIRSDFPSQQNH